MIKADRIEGNSKNIKLICSAIHDIDQSISGISGKLAIKAEGAEQIRSRLKNINEQILKEAAMMDSLSGALLHIAELYRKAEKQIIGSVEYNTKFYSIDETNKESVWEKIKNWFVENGLSDPEKQERINGETVTAHQQKEQDLYLQKEIESLNKQKRYSKKEWKKASTEERKKILEEYIEEVSAIMGLDIDKINFFYSEAEDGYCTGGYFVSKDNSIYINEWIIAEGDTNSFPSRDLFSTAVHELRHAYQDMAIKNPDKFVVTEESIEKWEKSYEEYKDQEDFEAEGMSEKDAFKAYRDQEIEQDARNFANQW